MDFHTSNLNFWINEIVLSSKYLPSNNARNNILITIATRNQSLTYITSGRDF